MKKLIKTGVCLFVILLSVMLPVMVTVIAQSGHGGSTQVLAHIGQPSAESSAEPSAEPSAQPGITSQPDQQSSVIQDEKPAKTGDTALPLIIAAAGVVGSSAILAVVLKKGNNNNKASKHPAAEDNPKAILSAPQIRSDADKKGSSAPENEG